ncbi:MAG: polysaccharide deacetylase family protein [Streptosporangiaceae bacterium]
MAVRGAWQRYARGGAAVLAAGLLLGLGAAASVAASPAGTLAAAAAASQPAQRAAQHPARTVVSFTWGGGFANQMGALPIFRQYHMHATYYVPSGLICVPATDPGCAGSPYLTLDDLHTLAAAGDEVGGLSVQHVPLTPLPSAEAQREICQDRVTLTRWGLRVTDFAYPFAAVSPALQDLVRRCGYNTGLGAGELRGAGLCQFCAWAETIPPRNPYLLRAPIEVASVGTRWTPATFESIVTGAQRHGGGWIIFNIHDVCARGCALGVTKPELSSVLAWLAGQAGHGITVRTVHQVAGGPVRPAVPGPVPPPIGGPGVSNAALSIRGPGGVPACFQTARYGSNTASFSYHPAGGPGGAGAEAIRMTGWQSGDAKLLPTLDLGQCAPGISASRSYTVSEWYQSSRPVRFDLYYRTMQGSWVYWASSPAQPAASTWAQASWSTPAVPRDATALSFGLAIGSDGTVSVSRYSLEPVRYSGTRLLVFAVVVLALLGYYTVRRRRFRRGGAGRAEAGRAEAARAGAGPDPARGPGSDPPPDAGAAPPDVAAPGPDAGAPPPDAAGRPPGSRP